MTDSQPPPNFEILDTPYCNCLLDSQVALARLTYPQSEIKKTKKETNTKGIFPLLTRFLVKLLLWSSAFWTLEISLAACSIETRAKPEEFTAQFQTKNGNEKQSASRLCKKQI